MLAWDKNSNILIWGTGNIGKKFYYQYRDKYNIVGFIDTYAEKKNLYGIPVFRPDIVEKTNEKIVIAISNYEDLLKTVLNLKRFFFDILPYDWIEYKKVSIVELLKYVPDDLEIIRALCKKKEMVILHGNCQISILNQYLIQNPFFYNNYIIFELPLIHWFKNSDLDKFLNNKYLFEQCAIFVTQEVSKNNAFEYRLSSEYLINKFTHSQIVIIPNLYFDVYFAQTGNNRCDVLVNEFGIEDMGAFPYGDEILADLSRRYTDSSRIVEIVKNDDLFSETLLNQLLYERMKDIQEREERCDLEMLDYILDNYRNEKLFYTRNHPVNSVIKELCVRLLNYLKIDVLFENENMITKLDISDELIYPSVEKGLHLEFHQQFYTDTDGKRNQYTFEQFVERYLSYCHSVFRKRID